MVFDPASVADVDFADRTRHPVIADPAGGMWLYYETYGREGHLAPGMVVSVESYLGEKGRREGVKLEGEILITKMGTEPLSRFSYEDDLLDGRS